MEGFRTAAAYDNSNAAVAAFNANLPPAARHCDLALQQPALPPVDLLVAGPPCQGFSTIGKRQDYDPRNLLLSRVADIAEAVRPRVIVVENVPAALSGLQARHWLALEGRLRRAGYNVRRLIIDGETAGIAQHRRRLFLICWQGSEHRTIRLELGNAVSVASALAGLDGLTGHSPRPLADQTKLAIAQRIHPGQKLSNVRLGDRNVATWDIPEVFGAVSEDERRILVSVARLRRRARTRNHGEGDPVTSERLEAEVGFAVDAAVDRLIRSSYLRRREGGMVDLRHTYNGKYRRLRLDAPAPTVDTHFASASNFLHPTEHRGLSLREAMRLQGFPDWFALGGAIGEGFRMVGNAVPPPMARVVSAFVRDALLKD